MFSEATYTLGTMRRVRTVELIRPPLTVIANGLHRFDPSCVLIAIGNRPRSVVMVVIRIGLSLSLEAINIAFL